MRVPVPSHHGHGTVLSVPPSFEVTWPVPRQGGQLTGGVGSGSASVTSGRG